MVLLLCHQNKSACYYERDQHLYLGVLYSNVIMVVNQSRAQSSTKVNKELPSWKVWSISFPYFLLLKKRRLSLENYHMNSRMVALYLRLRCVSWFGKVLILHPDWTPWQLTYQQSLCRTIWNDVWSDRRWKIAQHRNAQHHQKSQKTESCVYHSLHAHAIFDIACFPALVGASDVISSFLTIGLFFRVAP